MGNAGYYTREEAARIAKVPRSTVGYWAKTRLIVPSHKFGRWPLYSFQDLRDLVVCRKLKERSATVRAIRKALGYVRSVDDVWHLAEAGFGVTDDGDLIYQPRQEDGVAVRPDLYGQRVFWVPLKEALDELGARPNTTQLVPRKGVVIDPRIKGGAPVVRGTRIPTRLIAEIAADGTSVDSIIALYPILKPEDIRAALDYENEHGTLHATG